MNLPNQGKTPPSSSVSKKHPPTFLSPETCQQLESKVPGTKTRLTWKIEENNAWKDNLQNMQPYNHVSTEALERKVNKKMVWTRWERVKSNYDSLSIKRLASVGALNALLTHRLSKRFEL